MSIAIKLVTIGDGNVGKTCALMTFSYNAFPGDYIPTILDDYAAIVARNGKMIYLTLWDTSGTTKNFILRVVKCSGLNHSGQVEAPQL